MPGQCLNDQEVYYISYVIFLETAKPYIMMECGNIKTFLTSKTSLYSGSAM